MSFLTNIFKLFVKPKVNQYQQSVVADVDRRTFGKVQAKVINAQHKADQAAMKQVNKGLDVLDGKPFTTPQDHPSATTQHSPSVPGHSHISASKGSVRSHQQEYNRTPNYSVEGVGARTEAIDISKFNQNNHRVVGWLVARNGNHRGQDFRLYPGKTVIGTAADCNLVVTDSYLSARHTTIQYENGRFVAMDLDSKNGTYVNQKRISKEELIDNDTIRLGKTEFKFKSLD